MFLERQAFLLVFDGLPWRRNRKSGGRKAGKARAHKEVQGLGAWALEMRCRVWVWGDGRPSQPPSQDRCCRLPSSSGKPPRPGRALCPPALRPWEASPNQRTPTSTQVCGGKRECAESTPNCASFACLTTACKFLSSLILEAGLGGQTEVACRFLPPAQPHLLLSQAGDSRGLRMKLSPPHWPLSCLFVVSWGWDLGTEPWPPALHAQRACARSPARVGCTALPSKHCSLTLGHPSWPVQLSVQEVSERVAGAGSQVWGLRRVPGPPVWYALCPLPSSWLYSVPVTPSWGQTGTGCGEGLPTAGGIQGRWFIPGMGSRGRSHWNVLGAANGEPILGMYPALCGHRSVKWLAVCGEVTEDVVGPKDS